MIKVWDRQMEITTPGKELPFPHLRELLGDSTVFVLPAHAKMMGWTFEAAAKEVERRYGT